MKLSITRAAELANVSRTTLYNDMNSGKLTYEIDGKDKKVIDISELERVYGTLHLGGKEEASSPVQPEQNYTDLNEVGLHVELAVLREKLKTLEFERGREREQFSNEIEHLRDRLQSAESERTKLTAVLTDQREEREARGTKQIEQEQKLVLMEKTILALRRQNKTIMENLQMRQEKPLWKKLFG